MHESNLLADRAKIRGCQATHLGVERLLLPVGAPPPSKRPPAALRVGRRRLRGPAPCAAPLGRQCHGAAWRRGSRQRRRRKRPPAALPGLPPLATSMWRHGGQRGGRQRRHTGRSGSCGGRGGPRLHAKAHQPRLWTCGSTRKSAEAGEGPRRRCPRASWTAWPSRRAKGSSLAFRQTSSVFSPAAGSLRTTLIAPGDQQSHAEGSVKAPGRQGPSAAAAEVPQRTRISGASFSASGVALGACRAVGALDCTPRPQPFPVSRSERMHSTVALPGST